MNNAYKTPQLKFYKTSGSVYKSRQNSYRTRTQGSYSPKESSSKGLSEEDQYVDLTVQSIKKNYNLSNLKPFAVNKNMLKSVKKQVQQLKQQSLTRPTFYNINDNMKLTLDQKINKVLDIARLKGKGRKKHRKFHLKHLIQTDLQDEHENLIVDYQEQTKNQKIIRQKTILEINNRIQQKYPENVDIDFLNNHKKQKILKFKKSIKVVKKYGASTQETLRQQIMNYTQNALLQVQKQDYGIYSRSVDRALYFKSNNKITKNKQKRSNSNSNLKIDKKFYLGYMSSYSQRRNMLTNSGL